MRIAGIVMLVALSACARPPVKTATPITPPPATPAQRLASADRLVDAGCLDCLVQAYDEYELLRTIPSAVDTGTAGAIRSAALIALRQRELGMTDEGYGQRARLLLAGAAREPAWLRTVLDVIEAMPVGGLTRTPTSDLDLDRSRSLRTNHEAWRAMLSEHASADVFGAYVWLAFACATENRDVTADALFAPTEPFRESPLIVFRRAMCRGPRADTMQALVRARPALHRSRVLHRRLRRQLDDVGPGQARRSRSVCTTTPTRGGRSGRR